MKKDSATLFLFGLMVFFVLSQAARPEPAYQGSTETTLPDDAQTTVEDCGEECLMRRTLVAHMDFIYTTKKPGT